MVSYVGQHSFEQAILQQLNKQVMAPDMADI
jgi:hypothetical protein